MSRTEAERISDVRQVLEAARTLVRERAELAAEIARTTGLSPEGVELAMTEHLETTATDAELASLVARAGDAPRVHVILSANVFIAALRAIAIARAASRFVTVRPSRREPVFARALVGALGCTEITLAENVAPMEVTGGEIHVYGRDETIARVRAAARPGVVVRGHGAGMGIAWIGPGWPVSEAARALASDVVPFDQRGCLSPRVALVLGDEARAEAFAEALHDVLGAWETKVPRGELSREEAETAARYSETMTFAGKVFEAPGHIVALAHEGSVLAVPPPGRHVHVARVSDARSVASRIAPLSRAIVAVGASDPTEARAFAPAHARVSVLGQMQRPPLDGPVDNR